MKIALFSPQLSLGGAQQVTILLASALIDAGHEVIVVTPLEGGELAARLRKECQTFHLGVAKPLWAKRRLARIFDQETPDAVICFGIYTGIAAALSKFLFRWKATLLIRNENNLAADWRQANSLSRLIGPPLSRWVARRAKVIAVTRSLATATEDFLRLSPGRVATILNPVFDHHQENSKVAEAALHPWLTDEKGPVFVAMGRLEYQKGFDILIEAFSLVTKQTHARLVIFGGGSTHDALSQLIALNNLERFVSLAGFTNYPIAQLTRAHTFVLSSRFEGFGLVLVEAMWAGTRIVSTDCKYGPSDILENGRYGKLVPVEDKHALATAMLETLQEPSAIPRPDRSWFHQFSAAEAARQHLALIDSLHNDASANKAA